MGNSIILYMDAILLHTREIFVFIPLYIMSFGVHVLHKYDSAIPLYDTVAPYNAFCEGKP